MVHFLWKERHAKYFSAAAAQKDRRRRLCARFRQALRLIAAHGSVESFSPVTDAVHRFEESIAGRPYLIEVANVSHDRWRAYIVRIPGVPAALMPFYGTTPADAAHQLCEWLTRAHARAANPSSTV
jgi:hypothetical protein